MRLLNGDYLFNTPQDNPSGYFLALTIGFVVLFIASALVYWRRAKLARTNPVARRFIRRAAKAGMWTAGVGLFLAAIRYLKIDYVGMPFWMLLLILTMIGIVGYFVFELSENYPVAVHRLQESSLERRFRPSARPRPEPQRARPSGRFRGKRRR